MYLTDKNILVFDELDSTNNYARQMVAEKQVKDAVVLAHYQQKGKGQQGNFWESEKGKNLTFSLVSTTDYLHATKQFYISKVVSVALVNWMSTEAEDVRIKWPNDIYVGKKKVAGILIENTIKGQKLDTSIIGIGLNLNQKKFYSDAPNPVSLKQLSGKDYAIELVLQQLLQSIDEQLNLLRGFKFTEIDDQYLEHLYLYKKWSWYKKDGKTFEARIVGIGEFGQLQLETKQSEILEFMFKEVEFVI